MMSYPKRLIEVDLPIKRISEHARREKSIRHGHISTLHIWWARRPLAACRAVLCAALWPDPVDEHCPQAFRDVAAAVLCDFAEKVRTDADLAGLCKTGWARWNRTTPGSLHADDWASWPDMRYALLDFIADFANWDASTVSAFLDAARVLTHVAHLALTFPDLLPDVDWSQPGALDALRSQLANLPRPLVVDPFAGGGAIPLEALRVGADAFASDLNPVAVLLNKVVLEYIPRYGQRLADEVRRWGTWIKGQAEQELAEFYPQDPDGATPIAYLWARTVICEGPGCGAEVPLMRSLWLAKKRGNYHALRWVRNEKKEVQTETVEVTYVDGEIRIVRRPQLEIFCPKHPKEVEEGTVRRGAATCPVCGYTVPIKSVRRQLCRRRGGAADARLFALVTTRSSERGRFYRQPTKRDLKVVHQAVKELEHRKVAHTGLLSLVPDEPTPQGGGSGAGRAFSQRNYGMDQFEDLFSQRQALLLTTLARLVKEVSSKLADDESRGINEAVSSILACAVDREAEHSSSLCRWNSFGQKVQATFGRQALPMLWDYAEVNPFGGSVGAWETMVELALIPFETALSIAQSGNVNQASAMAHPLPNDSVQAFVTDPPYYDAVPYSDLSDFFYVWLKRTLGELHPGLFSSQLTPKDDECIVDEVKGKDRTYFESGMTRSMAEGKRILAPNGVGLVIFAHKTTSGWEAQLQAMIEAGWTITGSWPIDTEMGTRLRAMHSAALASSIHLVCRPREQVGQRSIGDWRDVLHEVPERILEWLPRLAKESIVGADAIFACLGPALEIFSRYDRVERANGDEMALRDYLEVVWAAVSNEALTMVFEGADASGFEADARLTAMWLWTLSTRTNGRGKEREPVASTGYTLEYDTARKIAQGLGAHLEQMAHVIEVKGDKARLLPVQERTRHLFAEDAATPARRRRHRTEQMSFLDLVGEAEGAEDWGEKDTPALGDTVLDRLHQGMILFAAGRSAALDRFLVEEGVGQDTRFWGLAQALSALYPSNTDEKRWVDGVLARKKGLGF